MIQLKEGLNNEIMMFLTDSIMDSTDSMIVFTVYCLNNGFYWFKDGPGQSLAFRGHRPLVSAQLNFPKKWLKSSQLVSPESWPQLNSSRLKITN